VASLTAIVGAEYNMLRDEIGRYHDHQKQTMNFAFVIMAAMFGIYGAALGSTDTEALARVRPLFLLFPVVYTLLAFIYADRTLRIIRIADYIHNHLRLHANAVSRGQVWQWELYKRHTKLFSRRIALVLDKTRWLVFILPSVVAIVIYLTAVGTIGEKEIIFTSIDGVITICGLLAMFVTEETTGVRTTRPVDLADAERREIELLTDVI
jgi:hypothetical protein